MIITLHSIVERALGSFNFIYFKKKALLSFLHSIVKIVRLQINYIVYYLATQRFLLKRNAKHFFLIKIEINTV